MTVAKKIDSTGICAGRINKRFAASRRRHHGGESRLRLFTPYETEGVQPLELGQMVTSKADVEVVMGKVGAEVLPAGGASLHDVPGWFPNLTMTS